MRRLGWITLVVLCAVPAAGAAVVAAGPNQRPAFSLGVPGPIPDAVAGRKYPGYSFCRPTERPCQGSDP